MAATLGACWMVRKLSNAVEKNDTKNVLVKYLLKMASSSNEG